MGASSLQKLLNYATAGNFTYDSTKVQFASGRAKLKLIEELVTFTQAFTADTEFTYDNTKAEFTGGVVRQKDQTPANSILGATYTSSINASWNKAAAVTGTLNGTPTIAGGLLVCTGAAQKGISYLFTNSGIGSVKFKYTPAYSGSPSTNVNMIAISNATVTTQSQLMLTHSPSGNNLRVFLRDSSGVSIYSAQSFPGTPVPAFTQNVASEVELTWDNVAGVIRVFIDGNIYGTLTPGAWAHGTTSANLYVGANAISYNVADASFNDVVLFSTVQHTLAYTPGYTLPEYIYVENKVDLPVFVFGGLGAIISVNSSSVVETSTPRYIVAGRYWNGSTWAVSDGSYAQAGSSAATIANFPSFPATGATSVTVSVVFGDTNTQQAVDDIQIVVLGSTTYPTDNPTVLENSGQLMDALEGFTELASVISGSDLIKYTLVVNGQDKYWSGSAWANSDGTYAQANTAAEIEANKAELDLGDGATVKIRAFLHSEDGSSTPEIETVQIDYNFFNTQNEPATCTVWGFYRDVSGNGVAGAIVSFALNRTSSQYREAGDSIIEKKVSVTTDANGRFEVDLIRTSEFEEDGQYLLTIAKDADSLDTSVIEGSAPIVFSVPDLTDVNITDLVTSLAA